jgi:hypothetical protein
MTFSQSGIFLVTRDMILLVESRAFDLKNKEQRRQLPAGPMQDGGYSASPEMIVRVFVSRFCVKCMLGYARQDRPRHTELLARSTERLTMHVDRLRVRYCKLED